MYASGFPLGAVQKVFVIQLKLDGSGRKGTAKAGALGAIQPPAKAGGNSGKKGLVMYVKLLHELPRASARGPM